MMFNLLKERKKEKDKYIVLIEPGGIGDYVFCRPFFKYFNESPKYKNFKLIYIVKEGFLDFFKEKGRRFSEEAVARVF